MITAKEELEHAVSTFSEEEAERALWLLDRDGLLGPADEDDAPSRCRYCLTGEGASCDCV
jgi:hypothetical protein